MCNVFFWGGDEIVSMTPLYVDDCVCVVLVAAIHACCSQFNLATVLCKQSDGCVNFPTHTRRVLPSHTSFNSLLSLTR